MMALHYSENNTHSGSAVAFALIVRFIFGEYHVIVILLNETTKLNFNLCSKNEIHCCFICQSS